MTRLFLRGISPQVSAQDLQMLFTKLHPVHEVYLPSTTITGIHRDFAIVNMEVNEDEARSCMKILNGSMWKGCKLRLEIAREFYQDKLNQERLSVVETAAREVSNMTIIEHEAFVIPPLSRDTIVLKHRMREYEISMKPRLIPQAMINKGDHHSLIVDKEHGRRTVIPCGTKRVFDDSNDDDDRATILGSISYNAYDDHDTNNFTEGHHKCDAIPSHHDVKQPSKQEKPSEKKKTMSTVAPIGGGVRRGFGSLLSISVDSVRKTKDDIDCCIDTATIDNTTKVIKSRSEMVGRSGGDGGLSSDDDEPCVKQEDLDDSALRAERQRALSILNKLLTMDNNGNDSQDNSGKKIDDDHTKPMKFLSNDAILSTKDGYADVDQLKSIFHREGGVWWGDDGSMKQAVRRGAAASDPMFLEAERRGIELRPQQHLTQQITSMGVDNVSTSGIASDAEVLGIGGDGKSMVFSFFASDPTDDINGNLHDVNEKIITGSSSTTLASSIVATPDCITKSNSNPTIRATDGMQQQLTQELTTLPIAVDWTLFELIQTAKRFSRTKSIEQMTEDWKVEREKLKIDYKRKIRDLKRRTASRSATDVIATSSRNNITSVVEMDKGSSLNRNSNTHSKRYSGNKTHHGRSSRRNGRK